MSSFGKKKSRRAYCANCERKQRVDTLFEKIVKWGDDSSGALLHKSVDVRTAARPGQTYPATFVTGMPSAV